METRLQRSQQLADCSRSSSLAKKVSSSSSFWIKSASSSRVCRAAFWALVELPASFTFPRARLFRGRVKSWNSRTRFLFCWLTDTSVPFRSLGSSKMVSKHLRIEHNSESPEETHRAQVVTLPTKSCLCRPPTRLLPVGRAIFMHRRKHTFYTYVHKVKTVQREG